MLDNSGGAATKKPNAGKKKQRATEAFPEQVLAVISRHGRLLDDLPLQEVLTLVPVVCTGGGGFV